MQSVEEIKGNDKLILVYPINVVKRGVVVGIKIEADNSISYTISKHRNESIKAYGNAIVPQVAFQIFKAINQYEEII